MFCIEEEKNEEIKKLRILTSPCTRNNYHYFLNHIFLKSIHPHTNTRKSLKCNSSSYTKGIFKNTHTHVHINISLA